MPIDAVIFDLDGTLVDANGLHTRAWVRAMAHHGFAVGEDRVAIEIGKGGTMLVPSVLGGSIERDYGDALRTLHDRIYLDLVDDEGVRPFRGVTEMVEALRARGLRTAIATAANEESLKKVIEASGLALFDLFDAVVTDTDVDRSKPHPDVVEAAVDKLGLSPAQCVMVGDTPYDVAASRRAGVVCLGVLTGVHDRKTFMEAGARAVYADVADLLSHLDEALALAGPGQARMTEGRMQALMDEALSEARTALEQGDVPVGAVVARSDGTVVARGHSTTESGGDFTAHAEMNAFRALARGGLPEDGGLVLVTTLEPCMMCYGGAMGARIDTIVYALEAPCNGGITRCEPMRSPGMVTPRVIRGIGRADSRDLFARWLDRHPDSAFARQLLETV